MQAMRAGTLGDCAVYGDHPCGIGMAEVQCLGKAKTLQARRDIPGVEGVAEVMTALPVLIPLVYILMRKLRVSEGQL